MLPAASQYVPHIHLLKSRIERFRVADLEVLILPLLLRFRLIIPRKLISDSFIFVQGNSFQQLKLDLQARGKELEERTKSARDLISTTASPFFRDGVVVMTHGYSRVVLSVLKKAARRDRRITVISTESRPQNNGPVLAARLTEEGIPVTLISDSSAAHMMDQVDLVFVGAEAVVENGGIINNMGTYQLALVAKAHNKPFYVAAETFKMTRDFPLNQQTIPIQTFSSSVPEPVSTADYPSSSSQTPRGASPEHPAEALVPEWHQPMLDYTPPQYITLLFTDLGVLPPSAVSDELIKFDQVVPERNFS